MSDALFGLASHKSHCLSYICIRRVEYTHTHKPINRIEVDILELSFQPIGGDCTVGEVGFVTVSAISAFIACDTSVLKTLRATSAVFFVCCKISVVTYIYGQVFPTFQRCHCLVHMLPLALRPTAT